jgi:salicylate hydroxylase
MRVAVVGGGISGLAVAAALQRVGVSCQVYEQADELTEIGAGIQVSPNGARLLHRLGMAAELDRVAVRPDAIEVRRWNDDEPLAVTPLGAACERLYGVPYYTLHRADLHAGLLSQVDPATVHLNKRCVGVAEHDRSVTLTFADGTTADADVVLGADGIKSSVRAQLIDDRPRFAGHAIFRGLVPAESVPDLAAQNKVVIWMGPGQHCVSYPISSGKTVSFAASCQADEAHGESWTSRASSAEVLAAYDGWSPLARSLLAGTDEVSVYLLYDREAVPGWGTDRIMLIGDAAHPMLPFGAQGASQGIEDAVAVATVLAGATVDSAPVALRAYEQVRRARITEVHAFIQDNERNHHVEDDAAQARDEHMAEDFGLRQREWLFAYDAEAAARPS